MGGTGTVELKLVYTSKVGTKTEVSKYIAAEPKHIEGLVKNQFFKNDPEVQEWARSVIKIETDSLSNEKSQPNATAKKQNANNKRSYAYAGASTSGTGLTYRWETQARVNGKFVKKQELAHGKGASWRCPRGGRERLRTCLKVSTKLLCFIRPLERVTCRLPPPAFALKCIPERSTEGVSCASVSRSWGLMALSERG
jgi:hypothetical protein